MSPQIAPLSAHPEGEGSNALESVARAALIPSLPVDTVGRRFRMEWEYRTRLTADIVTGKLDAREAAAKLPDLPSDTVAAPVVEETEEEIETEEGE
jgi:type I restriction enzyme S subunit